MSRSTVIMPLAKVMIAAAWADGTIANDEINCLKDLLFQLPEMTARDWSELDIYIDSPVGEAERERLVAELNRVLSKREDKALALKMIDELANADGEIPENERAVIDEITEAIEGTSTGIFGGLSRMLGSSMQRRSQALLSAPNRELYLEDYQKNRIFYSISRRLELEQSQINTSEDELRKLSLAGGLMARVAYADHEVQESEFDGMVAAMRDSWGISEMEATMVVEVAVSEVSKGMDYYRLAREFFIVTSHDERVGFIKALFKIASQHGGVSSQETEEIRSISKLLKLTHKQFIEAKIL
jgi:uncharacterized tellurite resistance protein B-like protein